MMNDNETLTFHWDKLPEDQLTMAALTLIFEGFKINGKAIMLAPVGESRPIIARLRMTLSRARNQLERQGIPYERFILATDVFPYSLLNGKHYDAIVFRKRVRRMEKILNILQHANTGDNANV